MTASVVPDRLSMDLRFSLLAMATLGAAALAVLMSWERAGLAAALTAAAVYGGVALLVRRALLRARPARFGAANAVTLARAALTAVLAGVAVETLIAGARAEDPVAAASWAITGGAALTWLLDALDGWIARRLGLASEFGARFDMEVDALFMLALSLLLYGSDKAGAWVLLSGVLRYLFVAAGTLWPALTAPLAPSFRRRAVCAAMSGVLVLATFPPLPSSLGAILLGMGVLALLWSFAVDSVTLLRRAMHPPAAARIGA